VLEFSDYTLENLLQTLLVCYRVRVSQLWRLKLDSKCEVQGPEQMRYLLGLLLVAKTHWGLTAIEFSVEHMVDVKCEGRLNHL
jgi:hypothetical protein